MGFFVPGLPRPQGSMKPMMARGGRGRIYMKQSPHLYEWREKVQVEAQRVMATRVAEAGEEFPITGPVMLEVAFYFDRPKSHPKIQPERDRGIKSNGADLDKLVRAIGDALTNSGIFEDDRQVASLVARKRYVGPPSGVDEQGAWVSITRMAGA